MDLQTTTSRLAAALHALREEQGYSIGALARKARIAKSTLSNIEAGTGNPSLEVLWRLADALNVPLGLLLGVDTLRRPLVLRAGEGAAIESTSGFHGWLLLAEDRGHRTEVLSTVVPPQVDYRAPAHVAGTEELVFCVAGSLITGPVGDAVTLATGDAVRFPADVPHQYCSAAGAKAIVVMSYPLAHRLHLGL